MATAAQTRLIGWPGSPVYGRQLSAPRQFTGGHWIALAVIILLGGALRFLLLDQPAIWGDEAATFGRTSGSFVEMCDILRSDGFAPLHYELIWWLHTHFILTPFMLRLVPAIAGTLTVPAMYFLGRMLTSRRVALWAALFTACSAWMLNYSRDAKMYSDFWLFCTLNYACLIWWCRRKSGIAWWCFAVSGIAMVGIDALGFIVIGVGLIWYLTQARVHWLSTLAYLAALAVIGLGPAVYYHYFNDWHRNQLSWINYTDNSSTGSLLLQLTSSLLFKYQFSGETVRWVGTESDLAPRIGAVAMAMFAVIVLVGALPWRKQRGSAGVAATIEDTGPTVWWRTLFWLLAATVLPVYAWYCASRGDFATPMDWAILINQHAGGLWAEMIILAAVVGAFCMASRELASTLAMLLMIGLAIVFGGALERGGWNDPQAILNALANLIDQPWFILAVGGAGAGLLWNYCAPAGFVRLRAVLAFFGAAALADAAAAALVALWLLCWRAGMEHQSFSPMDLLHGWERWLLYPGILLFACVLPVCIQAYRGSVDLRWRLHRWAIFLGVVAGIVVLCEGITILLGHPVQSLWVPRYLGMVWMPMAVGLVILISRLPTRGLRAAALVGVIGINLFAFGLRVLADNEPPIDKVVEDIAAAREHPEHLHTIAAMAHSNWGPGGGSMDTHVGEYYLEVDRLRHGLSIISPEEFYFGNAGSLYDFDDDLSAGRIHQILAQNPRLTEIIVWTSADADTPDSDDEVIGILGPGWKLVRDQHWAARDHWTWKEFYVTRRRVYRKS